MLPSGFIFERNQIPSPLEVNKLLASCKEPTYSPRRLLLAMEKSFCNLSIFEEKTGKLFGFVRATSDKGLNANLWNLAAQPGKNQQRFLEILVNRSLAILRREMPGCSISIAAPESSIQILQSQGFLLDPAGIRAMGYKLR